jgi:hypothetical protein
LRKTARAWPPLLGLLVACSHPASTSDYLAVHQGMNREAVAAALSSLGSAHAATVEEAAVAEPPLDSLDRGQISVLGALKVVRWGTREAAVFIGFDERDMARAKVLHTPTAMAFESFGVVLVNGVPRL